MNSSENFGSSCMVAIMAALVMRVTRHSSIAVARCDTQRMAVETSFAKKVSRPKDANDRLLALLRNDGELDLALLDVEDRVPSVTL